MSLMEGGDIDLEKERKPREISREQGDLAAYGTEERKEKIQGAANIFGSECLEGCWWRWSPGKGLSGIGTGDDKSVMDMSLKGQ